MYDTQGHRNVKRAREKILAGGQALSSTVKALLSHLGACLIFDILGEGGGGLIEGGGLNIKKTETRCCSLNDLYYINF